MVGNFKRGRAVPKQARGAPVGVPRSAASRRGVLAMVGNFKRGRAVPKQARGAPVGVPRSAASRRGPRNFTAAQRAVQKQARGVLAVACRSFCQKHGMHQKFTGHRRDAAVRALRAAYATPAAGSATLTDKQAQGLVTHALDFRAVAWPEYTNKGKTRPAKGDVPDAHRDGHRDRKFKNSAKWNKITNAKWNKITNAKRKAKNRAYRAARIAANPAMFKVRMSDAQIAASVEAIKAKRYWVNDDIFEVTEIRWMTIDEMLEWDMAIYFGITSQYPPHEWLRFMTARGANLARGLSYNGRRNRPVWTMPEGLKIITQEFAENELCMQGIVLSESGFLTNQTDTEERLQNHYGNLKLGTGRLWRCVAKGRTITDPGWTCTFMTVSPPLVPLTSEVYKDTKRARLLEVGYTGCQVRIQY